MCVGSTHALHNVPQYLNTMVVLIAHLDLSIGPSFIMCSLKKAFNFMCDFGVFIIQFSITLCLIRYVIEASTF
jgi:hypothetical protein